MIFRSECQEQWSSVPSASPSESGSPSRGLSWPAPPRRATPAAPLRVLHIVNGEHFAGAERVQDLLALQLPNFACEVAFACVKPARFPALRRSQAVPLWDAAMRFRGDVRPALSLARRIRAEGYDLVHTHTPRSALIGRIAAYLGGVPMIHHLHSPTDRDSTQAWRNRLNAGLERWSIGGAVALVAVSHSLKRWAVERGWPSQRVHVVPNGVPVLGPLRERCPPTGDWTLGIVALFRPRKGLEVLLAALAQLRGQGLGVRCRAVGGFETPDYEQAIRRQATELRLDDAIEWRGFRTDVGTEMAQFDLFVLPSLFGEGLPMVVLEAMASGVPVIATRVEGTPEVVRDGVEGLLVEPGDADALAQAVARFINRQVEWRQLREAGHRRQAESFSDRCMAAGVAAVYRHVLGPGVIVPDTTPASSPFDGATHRSRNSCQVSGTALAAGRADNPLDQEPGASARSLTNFANEAQCAAQGDRV